MLITSMLLKFYYSLVIIWVNQIKIKLIVTFLLTYLRVFQVLKSLNYQANVPTN